MGALVVAVARPWRRLGPRTDPYTLPARARMGATSGDLLDLLAPPATPRGVLTGVLGPMVRPLARRVGRLVGQHDPQAVALALDRAGIRNVTPQGFALQQLTYAALGLGVGAVSGVVLGTRLGVVAAAVGVVYGPALKRSELERRTRRRRELMDAELLDVCGVMAVFARALPGLQRVTEEVVRWCRGEVATELSRVLWMIQSGTAPEMAFERAAELSPSEAAARLYRTLSHRVAAGGDVADTLLAQAEDLRVARRDAVKARAERRKVGMLILMALLVMWPMLILVASPIPRLITGVR